MRTLTVFEIVVLAHLYGALAFGVACLIWDALRERQKPGD